MSTIDKDILVYLYSLKRRGIKIGLHRTEELLRRCGKPHEGLPVIHIAGTNGKGSTAAIVASILKTSGYKVGLYTSPHLIRFNERIRINGFPISDKFIVSFLNRYQYEIDKLGSTFFETTTAMMFSAFDKKNVDVAIVEVGMGGRLDSSNVCQSVVSVITPIDFDHMEYLGNSLSAIANEKCGIIKKNVPVVSAPQNKEVMQVIQSSARDRMSPLFLACNLFPIKKIHSHYQGTSFELNKTTMQFSLMGDHQVTNAQTAVAASRVFNSEISNKQIVSGLKNVKWPGRLQLLSEDPIVYFDVGHNPHGINATLHTIRNVFPDASLGTVCAIKKSKDVEKISQILEQYIDKIITVQPENSNFFEPDSLANLLSQSGIHVEASNSLITGIKKCKSMKSHIWLIFGTHYIADEVFSVFQFPFEKGTI